MAETKCNKCGVPISDGYLCDHCWRERKQWLKKAGCFLLAGAVLILTAGKIKLKI